MNIRIRPFVNDDAQAFVDIYNQARPIAVAQLTEERFWSWFDDPALDPTRDVLIAADDQGPVGAIVAFPWPGHLAEGYVFFVGPSVLPEFRHHGVGRQLLQALIEDLAVRFPGKTLQTRLEQTNTRADEFLTRHMGFSIDRQFWRMAHYAPGKVGLGVAPEGFDFVYLQPGEDPSEAIALYRRILDDPLANQHLLSAEELRSWASLENFTANSFCLAKSADQVVGLCFQTFPRGCDHSQIQFLGVLPSERGKGVANYLLRLALHNAHEAGKRCVRLEVSGPSEMAMKLYRRLGFELEEGEVFYQRPLPDAIAPATT